MSSIAFSYMCDRACVFYGSTFTCTIHPHTSQILGAQLIPASIYLLLDTVGILPTVSCCKHPDIIKGQQKYKCACMCLYKSYRMKTKPLDEVAKGTAEKYNRNSSRAWQRSTSKIYLSQNAPLHALPYKNTQELLTCPFSIQHCSPAPDS